MILLFYHYRNIIPTGKSENISINYIIISKYIILRIPKVQ